MFLVFDLTGKRFELRFNSLFRIFLVNRQKDHKFFRSQKHFNAIMSGFVLELKVFGSSAWPSSDCQNHMFTLRLKN